MMILSRLPAKKPLNEQGLLLVAVLSIMVFLSIILIGIFSLGTSNLNRARARIFSLEAQYAAESGADAAVAILNSGNSAYTGTVSQVTVLSASNFKATYTVSVAAGATAAERLISATGSIYLPASATTPKFVRKIRVTAQQSSSSTAASLTSRNILAIDSSVKNVYAKDVYVNGFISMVKTTTNLTAENITVAGKNTAANNCSIGTVGTLLKPATFTTAGQTKTNITTAYNNCILPPGNSNNANFNVSANTGNVSTVQSIYIPWTTYMDSSYQNSPSGCNDWSSGVSPRRIPNVVGSKQTHYPDTASNTSASCGTNGDLSLGNNQYDIADNVHLRANLCLANQCAPTFNNTTASIKYVFIEGVVNFGSLKTKVGSGPLAFIIYGTDPAYNTSVCPYGGAAYLANSGTTTAPAIYLLATNGVCLDKTKFGANPSLGGIAGKNIYIATNSGSPFDLFMDVNFPVSDIPINTTWRAVRYQRM